MKYLFGPEIIWLGILGLAHVISGMNKSPDFPMDDLIDKSWFGVPVLIFITFGLYWIPSVEKGWLMLRIWIIGIVLGHFVMEKLMEAYSQQGPGSGMGYLAGMIFVLFALISGSVIVTVVK